MFYLVLILTIFIVTLLTYLIYKQDDLTEKNSSLAARKDELDASSKQWKSRVDRSELDNFTIAGRMQQQIKDIQIGIPNVNSDSKKLPRAKRYKGKDDEEQDEKGQLITIFFFLIRFFLSLL